MIVTVVLPLASVTPGPFFNPTELSPVQVPTSCTPGTGVPLLVSRLSVTLQPPPPHEDGFASRTRLPLAVIGAVAEAPAPLNVRPGTLVPGQFPAGQCRSRDRPLCPSQNPGWRS